MSAWNRRPGQVMCNLQFCVNDLRARETPEHVQGFLLNRLAYSRYILSKKLLNHWRYGVARRSK
jgi:hypothetical protein